MKGLNDRWFECSDGHVTVGNTTKKKCNAELWQLNYVKGKRKGTWIDEKTKKEKPCDKEVVNQGLIPPEINYFEVWDLRTAHAFLVGQKLDAEFLIGLQMAFKQIKDKIDAIEKSKVT